MYPLSSRHLVALLTCAGLLTTCSSPMLPSDTEAGKATLAAALEATLTAIAPTATPTSVALPTYTSLPTYTPPPTATPYPTYTPVPTRRPATKLPPAPWAMIAIRVLNYTYQQWGRPAGMDDPSKGCGSFDDRRPLTMLSVNLLVENKSSRPMDKWYGFFYAADDRPLYTCYYRYGEGSPFPSVAPGKAIEITFGTFTEDRYAEIHGFIRDDALGQSNEVSFPR